MRHPLMLGALLLVSCSWATEPELPDRSGVLGIVVATDHSTSKNLPTIHVKDETDQVCGIIFTVRSRTTIARRGADGELEDASLNDVQIGSEVRVWAQGNVVMRSCPGQATAEAVELLPV